VAPAHFGGTRRALEASGGHAIVERSRQATQEGTSNWGGTAAQETGAPVPWWMQMPG